MKKLTFILFMFLAGCITPEKCYEKYPPQVKDSISYQEIEKLVPVYISDSAGFQALLECDSLGKIRVKEIEQYYAGKLIKPTIEVRNNYVMVACNIDSGAVMVAMVSKWFSKVRVIVHQKPPTNILKGWQVFFIWTGGIALVIVLLSILYFLFKLKKKILFIALLLAPGYMFSQSTGSYWKLKNYSEKFNRDLSEGTLIRIADSARWITLTQPVTRNTTLQTVINSNWYKDEWNSGSGGTVTGISANSPLFLSGSVMSISQANTSTSGYLSSTNWNTFNNKVSSQWVTNSTNIYYNSGNIGISTTSPTAGLDVQTSSFVKGGNADPNSSGTVNSSDATDVKQYSYSLSRKTSDKIAKMDIGGIGFVPTIGTAYAVSNVGIFWPLANLQYNFKRAYGYSHDIVLTDSTHSSVILKDTVFLPKIGKRITDMAVSDSIIVSVPVVSNYGGGTDSKMIRKMEVAPVSALPFAGKTHAHAVKSPVSIVNDSIAISQANTSTSGYLSSADWNLFHNKVSSLWIKNGVDYYNNNDSVTRVSIAGDGAFFGNDDGVPETTFNVYDGKGVDEPIIHVSNDNSAESGAGIELFNYNSGEYFMNNSARLGYIDFSGPTYYIDEPGYAKRVGARIESYSEGGWGQDAIQSTKGIIRAGLMFSTRNGVDPTPLTPRMTIKGTGEVGIGLIAPLVKFQIASSKAAAFAVSTDNDGSLGDSTAIYVNAKGKIGIGTTTINASSALTINGRIHCTGDLNLGPVTDFASAIDRSFNELRVASGYSFTSIGMYLQGVHRLFINSTGNVGINTSNPSAAKFQIASKKSVQFLTSGDYDGSIGDSVGIAVTAKGTVGVGTTSPAAKLDVNGNVKVATTITTTAIPATDLTATGDMIQLTAGVASGIGDVVYINSSGAAVFCNADAIANCPYALAICTETVALSGTGNYLTKGSVRNDAWTWPTGALLYVSINGRIAETLTHTPPSESNNVIMPVGVALSPDVIYFFGNMNSVERL